MAKAAWNIVSRLPLIRRPQSEFNISSKSVYAFRYWLYIIDDSKEYSLITRDILRRILDSDIETTCIGLKIAHECSEFDVEIFNMTLNNIKNISSLDELSFFNKVLLDNSLKLFQSCLSSNKEIRNVFIEKEGEYDEVLISGLMSKNLDIRVMYCSAI
jgi:hypothetical protein